MRCPVCHCPNADEAVRCGRCGAPLKTADKERHPHHLHLRDVEEATWFKSSLILVTALLAALALGGAWWSLMHTTPDETRDESLAVQPALAPADAGNAAQPASAVIAAASPALPDGVASAPGAETALSAASAPEVVATPPDQAASATMASPPPVAVTPQPVANPPSQQEAVAGYVDASGQDIRTESRTPPPAAVTPARPASGPDAGSVAARLAACNRFAWYQVVQHESCVWAICDGRWGRDGCPAYPRNRRASP